MATCPKCRGEMKTLDLVCPHCGYDFPPDKPAGSAAEKSGKDGIEYSVLADIALLISAIAAAVGCVTALWMMTVHLFHTQFVHSLGSLLDFFLRLGILVVILRTMRAT